MLITKWLGGKGPNLQNGILFENNSLSCLEIDGFIFVVVVLLCLAVPQLAVLKS